MNYSNTTSEGYFDGDVAELSKELAVYMIQNKYRCPVPHCGPGICVFCTKEFCDRSMLISVAYVNDQIKKHCIQYLIDNNHADLLMEILLL